MTRIEYDLLREQEPQLKLPLIVTSRWETRLNESSDLAWLQTATREEVIAARTAELMLRGKLSSAHVIVAKHIARGQHVSGFVNMP